MTQSLQQIARSLLWPLKKYMCKVKYFDTHSFMANGYIKNPHIINALVKYLSFIYLQAYACNRYVWHAYVQRSVTSITGPGYGLE